MDDREFKYHGQLYDILYESQKDGITTFCCIRDVREEILMAGMRKAAGAKNMLSLYAGLITMALPASEKEISAEQPKDFVFPIHQYNLPNRPTEPFTPPPRKG